MPAPAVSIADLILGIWKHVEEEKKFFVIVEGEDHFYVADPDDIEQGNWGSEQKESAVMVFTSVGAAAHYREYLIEELEVQPSTVKVASVDIKRVYALLPKIKAFAKKKFGGPVRLQAVAYHGEYAFTEILFSELMPKH